MRIILGSLAFLLAASCWGQMSRSDAERYIGGMNAPLTVGRDIMIWSLTASDRELIQAVSTGKGGRGAAAAIEMGRRQRPNLTEAMARALPNADEWVGTTIVGSLWRNPTPVARVAVESAVHHKDRSVRWAAAVASAKWGFKGARAALADAVQHDRLEAVEPLAKVGSAGDVKTLRQYYDRAARQPYPGYGARPDRTALLAMAALRDPWAVSKLRKEVDHPSDRYFRASAIKALGPLAYKEDTPRFLKALHDPSMPVRFAAAEALGASGAKRAVSALDELAANPGPDAAQGEASDRAGRKYAAYVADCLRHGRRPLTQSQWNQTVGFSVARA